MKEACKRLLQNKLIQAMLWILGFAGFSIVALKIDSILTNRLGISTILPFVWIALVGAGICIYIAWRSNSQGMKLAFAYFSALPLCLAAGEVYGFYALTKAKNPESSTTCNVHTEGTYGSDYFTPSLITGYKGKPNVAATAHKRTANGDSVYQVTYHTDEFGWRITPSNQNSSQAGDGVCVLFFGDSFTIGEGVEDTQTLPHYVGEILNTKANINKNVRIYNFGFHGYGPHQALALLQSGEVESMLQSSAQECKSIVSIYESLPGHIERANGFSEWERGTPAPRFSIVSSAESSAPSDTKVIWNNRIESHLERLGANIKIKLLSRVSRSYLFKLLQPSYSYDQSYNALYFAILSTLQDELASRLDSPLILLLWDEHAKSMENERLESAAITKWLESASLPHLLVSQLLENYKTQREKYALHPCDMHPNALANEQIARKLAPELAKFLTTKE